MNTQQETKAKIDMINGPLWNKIPLFALPVAATAILEQLFNATDVAVVGNFTGSGKTVAVAAVGANSSIISMIVSFFIGIALGATVVIATAIGRKDKETITKAVHSSIIFAFLGGIVVAVIGELVSEPLLASMNVPKEVFPLALLYLRIYVAGMPAILLYNFEAAIFRSTGDTKTPLAVLIISGIINVVLNFVFVAALHLSVNGSALATVLANIASSVILFSLLRKTTAAIHVDWRNLHLDRTTLGEILRIGLPTGIQTAVFSVANIVIQGAINSLGTVIMAASSAAYNIEIMAYYLLNSFSQACTTFVGQNYGARQIKRCRKVLGLCLVEGTVATLLAISLILFFGHPLLALFNNDPRVVQAGYTRLMLILSGYFFSMVYENMSGYLRGYGISLIPALLTTIGICGTRFFWIFCIFPQWHTFLGILTVYPVSLGVTAFLIFLVLITVHPSKNVKYTKGKLAHE